MKQEMKRFLTLLLCVMLMITMMPTSVFAEDELGDAEEEQVVEEEVVEEVVEELPAVEEATVETPAEAPVEEATSEQAETILEEPTEETIEEHAETILEEPTEETIEEQAETIPEEPTEETIEEQAEAIVEAAVEETIEAVEEIVEEVSGEAVLSEDPSEEAVTSIEEVVEEAAEIPEAEIDEAEEIVEEKEQEEEDPAQEEQVAFCESKTVDGVTVTVKAEKGIFPEGSTLSVRKVSGSEKNKVESAVEEELSSNTNVGKSYVFDIKVLDKNGNEIQPPEGKTVDVSFSSKELGIDSLEPAIYHIDDGLNAEELAVTTDGRVAAAETEGFSYYEYIFTYNNLTWACSSSSGYNTWSIGSILEQLGIEYTDGIALGKCSVTSVTSSHPQYITATYDYAYEGEFVIRHTADAMPEGTQVTLTVVNNGVNYVINVVQDTHHWVVEMNEFGTQAIIHCDDPNCTESNKNYYLTLSMGYNIEFGEDGIYRYTYTRVSKNPTGVRPRFLWTDSEGTENNEIPSGIYIDSSSSNAVTYKDGEVFGNGVSLVTDVGYYEWEYGNITTYPVYDDFLFNGSNNHIEIPLSVKLIILPKAPVFAWTGSTFTYDGTAHKPTAKISNRASWRENRRNVYENMTAVVSGEQTVPGTYTATVTALEGDNVANWILPEEEARNFQFTINPKALTISAPSRTISYGEALDISELEPTFNGFVSGESLENSDLVGEYVLSCAYEAGMAPGTYPITVTGYTSNNYAITYQAGTLTVQPRTLTFDWSEDDFVFDGNAKTITATPNNVDEGDEIILTYENDIDNNIVNSATGFGEYTAKVIGIDGENKNNYKLSATESDNTHGWRITKAKLYVTANDNEITYGDAPVANGVRYTNSSEQEVTPTGLSGELQYAYSYEQYDAVGSYTITPSGITSDDYEIVFNDGTLTVNKKPITVSGITAEDKVYDGTKDATLVCDNAVFDGKIGEDNLSVTATGEFNNRRAGTDKKVTIISITLDGADKDNYVLAEEGNQKETTASITKKSATVRAEAKTKSYGKLDPEFTYTTEGMFEGDTFIGKLLREVGENVGVYSIVWGAIGTNDDYDIDFVDSTLTITQADNNVTVSIEGWIYGDAPNAPTATAAFGQETATFTYSDAEGGEFTADVPGNVGTWYVKAAVPATDNYAGAESDAVAFEIAKKEISKEMLTINPDTIKADGTEKSPLIVMEDAGKEMVEGTDYVVSGDVKTDKIGTHFITIEGQGNYRGSIETSWTIYNTRNNYQKEEGEGGRGALEIFVDINGNTENITVDNLAVDVAKTFLTEEDLARYNAGESVLIYVELFEEEKSVADATEEELLIKKFEEIGAEDIRWFDITVWKKIGNEAAQQVHEVGTAIEMTIEVPDEYQNAEEGYTRTFYFERAHEGVATILKETTYTDVTFSSDKFSTYALGFKDAENKKEEVEPGEGSGEGSEGSGSEGGAGDGSEGSDSEGTGAGEGSGSESGEGGAGEGSGSEGTGEAGTGEGADSGSGTGEGSGSGSAGTGEGADSGSGTGEGSGSESEGTGEAGTGEGAGSGSSTGEGSGSGSEGTGEGAGSGSGSGTGEGTGSGSDAGEAGNGSGANGETGPLTGTPNLIAGNPNTGDENNILIWIGVVLLAAAIALTVRRQFK